MTFVVLALCLAGAVTVLDGRLERTSALTNYAGRIADTPGTNWLVVGSDSRAELSSAEQLEWQTGDIEGTRTDTIILIHLSAAGARGVMVSIPRDSYVPIPGYGSDKVNAAFTLGGPALLVQTIEEATGVRIDHYAEVGLGGFSGVVDAVGGVRMCLDQPIADPLAGIELPAGCQELAGPEALGFVRTRATALADLQRMDNQRKFLAALMDKASKPSTLLNPITLSRLAAAGSEALTVGRSEHLWNLTALAWALRDGVDSQAVPVGGFAETDVGNVLLWDSTAAPLLFAALAADTPIPPPAN